jgi:hypothetical protein
MSCMNRIIDMTTNIQLIINKKISGVSLVLSNKNRQNVYNINNINVNNPNNNDKIEYFRIRIRLYNDNFWSV